MDNNQRSSADHIVEYLKQLDVDGETMQYIIDSVGMSEQVLKQLFFQASDIQVTNLIEERNSF